MKVTGEIQGKKEYLEKQVITIKKFKGEPFKAWKWAKEMRVNVYKNYAEAWEQGGLRVTGGHGHSVSQYQPVLVMMFIIWQASLIQPALLLI